jgi:hypothetical protein
MIVAFFYAGKKIPVYQVKHLLDFQKRFSTIDLFDGPSCSKKQLRLSSEKIQIFERRQNEYKLLNQTI